MSFSIRIDTCSKLIELIIFLTIGRFDWINWGMGDELGLVTVFFYDKSYITISCY